MKFVVDECTGPAVASWLEQQGYDVFSVYGEARGIDDDRVIELATTQQRILITNDRSFGEKIFRERRITASFFFVWLMSVPKRRFTFFLNC